LPMNIKEALTALNSKLTLLEGARGQRPARASSGQTSLVALNRELVHVFEIVQGTDNAPTASTLAAATQLTKSVQERLLIWKQIHSQDLPRINRQLRAANLPELPETL